MKKNVFVTSIGCRLNQFEIDIIRTELVKYGLLSNNHIPPDICIINTCTVTQKADSKSRAIVRKIIKQNPNSYIVVTGCYAHTNPEVFKKIRGVDLIVNNNEKMRLPEILKEKGIINIKSQKASTSIYITDRTRPYIKVQDGCNLNCSYCKVRTARGKSRSENFEKIINTAQLLANENYPEIVITGVNIGDYKWNGKDLADLLSELTKIKNLKRIRLTSIEPTDINEKLLKAIQNDKICSYFHIPLQSGSDKILKLMNRPYTREVFAEKIMQIRKNKSNTVIGTDVIVGFPGETDEDFNETLSLLKKLDIFYLHIFRYSKREGTPASNFKNEVQEEIKTQRAEILRKYRKQSKDKFFKSIIGKEFNVIIEHKIIKEKYINSISDNYIPILLPLSEAFSLQRNIVRVKIIRYDKEYLYGKIL